MRTRFSCRIKASAQVSNHRVSFVSRFSHARSPCLIARYLPIICHSCLPLLTSVIGSIFPPSSWPLGLSSTILRDERTLPAVPGRHAYTPPAASENIALSMDWLRGLCSSRALRSAHEHMNSSVRQSTQHFPCFAVMLSNECCAAERLVYDVHACSLLAMNGALHLHQVRTTHSKHTHGSALWLLPGITRLHRRCSGWWSSGGPLLLCFKGVPLPWKLASLYSKPAAGGRGKRHTELSVVRFLLLFLLEGRRDYFVCVWV